MTSCKGLVAQDGLMHTVSSLSDHHLVTNLLVLLLALTGHGAAPDWGLPQGVGILDLLLALARGH